ncbi:MAG: phosphate propanoyltransferase [Candidatus Parcubacteria bacterium]|nr:phosphate propanoyltransferase [Candidatus Parcubacteria bacterium]
MPKIRVEVSARHCHLNQKDADILFGKNHKFKVLKMISQPGQYAAAEEVAMKGPKGEFKVRIVGPLRKDSQVELAVTDCYRLGVKPVLKVSGNIKGTPGAVLIGPKGKVTLKQGLIVAQRHLHVSSAEAKVLKVKNGQFVSMKITGPRGLVFNKVAVRLEKNFKKSFQLDTDEGNACGWKPGMTAELIINDQ